MMTEPVLEAENIDKRFPGVHALDNVSLRLRQGKSTPSSGRTEPENQR